MDENPFLRIQRAFGAMPYGGICHFRPGSIKPDPSEIDRELEIIALNLESMVEVLAEVAKNSEKVQTEHLQVMSELRSVGSLLARISDAP